MSNKIKIVTDSNSGFSQEEAKELGIGLIPMPFTIDGKEYLEGINLTHNEFYELLKKDVAISTSQPSQYYLEKAWKEILTEYDEIIYIPMTSGLSASCESAKRLAEKFDGKVFVVDNLRISVPLKESIFEALAMLKLGKSASEIKEYLEKTGKKHSIYIMVETLKYLKRGGRITPIAAAIGTVLHIKPILSSRGDKFDKFSSALNLYQGKKKIINQLRKELNGEFKEEYEKGNITISVAYTNNLEEANKFKEEIKAAIPKIRFRFVDALSLSISCHTGPGALGAAIIINNYLE